MSKALDYTLFDPLLSSPSQQGEEHLIFCIDQQEFLPLFALVESPEVLGGH